MNKVKLFVFTLLIGMFAAQCKDKSKGGEFTVTVAYTNADKLPAMAHRKFLLEEIPYGSEGVPVILDSVSLKNNAGTVSLKGKAKEEGIYQVSVENGPVLLLVNDSDAINVTLNMAKMDQFYTVKGSEASTRLQQFIEQYSDRSQAINEDFQMLDSLKQVKASDSLVLAATNKKNESINSLNSYLRQFISGTKSPAVSIFALGLSSRSMPKEEFETELMGTVKKFPEHAMVKTLKQTFEMQQAQAAEMEKARASRSLVGKPAPNLTMPGADGKNISISDFKGKYLLVDFWASWCGPCRNENPNVVRVYDKFKTKNFAILGVSLDKEKAPWLKAIEADKLSWPHMSDLKFWDSEAVSVYGFEGIPYNVLIDPQGIIIAEKLYGFDLEQKLSEVLK